MPAPTIVRHLTSLGPLRGAGEHIGVCAVVFRNPGTWTGYDDLYFRKDEDIFRKLLDKSGQ